VLVRFLREETAKLDFIAPSSVSPAARLRNNDGSRCPALGAENLLAVIMPYRTSAPESLRHAQAMAERLEVATRIVDISSMVDAYFDQVGEANRMSGGTRCPGAHGRALRPLGRWRGLVLGTSNKTELLLGYGTLHGDMASR